MPRIGIIVIGKPSTPMTNTKISSPNYNWSMIHCGCDVLMMMDVVDDCCVGICVGVCVGVCVCVGGMV